MKHIFNTKDVTPIRKVLRGRMPKPEMVLWQNIRARKLKGYKFRRQFSIGRYVLDFYCPKIKLGIEIDGESHFTKEAQGNDKIRQEVIENFGVKLLRFTNEEVMKNIDGVISEILKHLP
jgi:very-short-patch-repair endonuclease